MKQFSCGDVVAGCDAVITGETEADVLAQVGPHAAEVHGMTEVPDEVITEVRQKIVDVPG